MRETTPTEEICLRLIKRRFHLTNVWKSSCNHLTHQTKTNTRPFCNRVPGIFLRTLGNPPFNSQLMHTKEYEGNRRGVTASAIHPHRPRIVTFILVRYILCWCAFYFSDIFAFNFDIDPHICRVSSWIQKKTWNSKCFHRKVLNAILSNERRRGKVQRF